MIFEDIAEFAETLPNFTALAGLDLGTVTLGVAVSDTLMSVATPLETIKRKKFGVDAASLAKICAHREVGGIVLGLPRNMDASEGRRAQSARAYARNLNEAFDLPVLLWDERWSTQSAEAAMIGQDMSRAKRAEKIDSHAAAIILQGAIDALAGNAF